MIKAYLKSLYFQTCQPDAVKRSFSNQWGSTTVMLQTVIKVFKGNRSRGYYPQLDPFLRHNGIKSFMIILSTPKNSNLLQGEFQNLFPYVMIAPDVTKLSKLPMQVHTYSEEWQFQSIVQYQSGLNLELICCRNPRKRTRQILSLLNFGLSVEHNYLSFTAYHTVYFFLGR